MNVLMSKIIVKEFLLPAPIMAASWSVAMFGQLPLMDGLPTLIGNIGITGVLVWHLWYHTTKSYPRMLAQFSKETALIRASAEQQGKQLMETFKREQDESRVFAGRENAELRNMLIQTLTSMRVAVHDVKDVAQKSILKEAASIAEAVKGKP